MAAPHKGIWEQKNVVAGYTSSDESDTESETEVSLYDLEQSGIVKPLTATANVVTGKTGPGASIAAKKRNGEQRMPTRRPDPKVLNRNALLARENRRKKKLYLESVESELQDARKVNRSLIKALKRQVKVAKRLEQEKRYYQNILANQSEISGLVTALSKRRVSIEQQASPAKELFKDPPHREPLTSCCSSSSYEPEPFTSPFGESSYDLDTDESGNFSPSSWDDLWNTDSLLTPEPTAQQLCTLGKDNLINMADDHNYVMSPDRHISSLDMPSLTSLPSSDTSALDKTASSDELQGICLHLTRENRRWCM